METVQEYKCPCCGAPLVYKNEALYCGSCGNNYTVETIHQVDDAQKNTSGSSKFDWNAYEPRTFGEGERVDLSEYTCPSCGAEITGDDTMGASKCPYCGNNTIIKKQFEGGLRPDFVIPFKIEKEAAAAKLIESYKGKILLPNKFKTGTKIEELIGVYVPFWSFDCDAHANMSYDATKIFTWSDSEYDYTKTDHYKLYRTGDAEFNNIPVDGSKKADDAYMDSLEPFDYSEAVDFDTAYLSGYLADKYDVSWKECIPRANERVERSVDDLLRSTMSSYDSVSKSTGTVEINRSKIRYALMPVWMMNVKYKEKLYRFAVNGQTGKTVGKYPASIWRVLALFAAVLGVSFAVFYGIISLIMR